MIKIFNIIVNRIKNLFAELSAKDGFMLIEIIIAITIIAILSIVAIPRLMDLPQKARIQAAKMQIKNFETALVLYSNDNSIYPSTEQGLQALVSRPDSEPQPMNYNESGYLNTKTLPKDPWGRDYIYACPGTHGNDYEIMSYGADGQEGGEGKNADITSWE